MADIPQFQQPEVTLPSDFITEQQARALISSALLNQTEKARLKSGHIQSDNFLTTVQGWQIDALGNAEFNDGFFRGTITATAGSIGGWTINAGSLSSGGVTISGANEQILFGAATAPLVGVGIFEGLDSGQYQWRVGDPAGDYILWDGSSLTVNASVSVNELHIPDQVTSNSFHTNTVGTSWWGANVADFNSDNDNAPAYILNDGTARFTSGTIANWTIGANSLSSGNVTIDSSLEQILLGAATAPTTGVGIFLGLDGADYEFRAGDPAGENIHWDGTNLNINGNTLDATILQLAGDTVNSTAAELNSTLGVSGNYSTFNYQLSTIDFSTNGGGTFNQDQLEANLSGPGIGSVNHRLLSGLSSTFSTLRWTESVTVEFSARQAIGPGAGNYNGWGLVEASAVGFGSAFNSADGTDETVVFAINNAGTLDAKVSNGTLVTATTIVGVTLSDFNWYKIVWTSGVDAKFYVNGVLEATISTTMPSASTNNPNIVLGKASNANVTMVRPTINSSI